ncbi:MAG: Bug family tripartite tricarboxylate transporter substrate binding protein [Hyphomicrobiaceae bacterium]
MRRIFGLWANIVLLVMSTFTLPAVAQDAPWPSKPVRIIVVAAPGGSLDNATRPLVEHLTKGLGQQFVVENRGGASGAIGAELAVKSPPDGSTFVVMSSSTAAILPNLRKLSFDMAKDLAPVSYFIDGTQLLTTHPSVPANTLAELVAYAKKNPGKLNFGNPGQGTAAHLFSELFARAAGIELTQVAYRGAGEALPDFLAGVTQLYLDPNALPHVKSGKVRLLAVFDSERHPDFPNIPTLREVYPELDDIWWFGLFAPAGTPDGIIRRMSAEMIKIAGSEAYKAQVAKVSLRPKAGSPEDLAAILKRDTERFGKLARELKLRME